MTTYNFEADINKLSGMIVKSFYSNKDIFLRELVSNASDALQKLRRRSLESNIDAKYEIRVSFDKEAMTLTVEDTGIGMTFDELKTNLGTIAKSGTADLLQKLADANTKNDALIGQFGVGFYSLYLIGDKATVYSKSIDSDKTWKWESTLDGTFTVSESEVEMERGTRIVINVKESEKSYLDENRLKKIIQTHSAYIMDPIYLMTKDKACDKEKCDKENCDKEECDEECAKENSDKDNNFTIINNQSPIWEQTPSQVTEEEHEAFYKTLVVGTAESQNGGYLDKLHCKVEGAVEFTTLLYIPKIAPYDLFRDKKKETSVKLYKNRVLITDDCKDIIPSYFNFFKGIIDSNEISLNVSREMLQKSQKIKDIKKHIIKKIIKFFQNMMKDNETYKSFYSSYHKNIKLGIHEDKSNKEELAKLLQYNSLNNQESMISLDSYVDNKKEDQTEIYYQFGTKEQLAISPFMTYYKNRGIDVIFCTDNIDEYCLNSLDKYRDMKLMDITKKKYELEDSKEYQPLCDFIKSSLKEKVEKVIISTREFEEPALIASSENGISSNMERIIKAQAYGDDTIKQFMKCRKVMELNINHSLIKHINSNLNEDKKVSDLIDMLFNAACLCSGFDIDDPVALGKKLNKMMSIFSTESSDGEEEKTESVDEIPNLDCSLDNLD